MTAQTCPNSLEQYADILCVYPIPFGELNHAVPFNVRKPTTTAAELGIADINTFLANRFRFSTDESPLITDGVINHLIEEKGTLKATPQKAISGHTYAVSMQLKSVGTPPGLRAYLFTLMYTEHDFIVECASGALLFIRCPENAYNCTPEENIADTHQTNITFDIKNVSGIQPII